MAENPMYWGPAEHVISDVLTGWYENEAKPPAERRIGFSLPFLITTALRQKGLLVDDTLADGIETSDPAPSPNGTH